MVYGLPYQGSKNFYVSALIKQLPPGETFVDLFAGGCAMSHAAILSKKYKNILINDITDNPKIFLNAINGLYEKEDDWVSREEFFKVKENNTFIKRVWSFSGAGINYFCKKEKEEFNKARYLAIVKDDFSLLNKYCKGRIKLKGNDIGTRNIELKNILCEYAGYLDNRKDLVHSLSPCTSLLRIQSLSYLKNNNCNIIISQKDYRKVEIPKNSVIYCDPPYEGTTGYENEFNKDEFIKWCLEHKENLFISEYHMPEHLFKKNYSIYVSRKFSSSSKRKLRVENLYCVL